MNAIFKGLCGAPILDHGASPVGVNEADWDLPSLMDVESKQVAYSTHIEPIIVPEHVDSFAIIADADIAAHCPWKWEGPDQVTEGCR